jgi:hypothetical protein
VLAYLRALTHPALLAEFEMSILPRVGAVGLDSPAMQEALRAQQRAILQSVNVRNWFEPPTRHIRGSSAL